MQFKKSSLALAVAVALAAGNAYAFVDLNANPAAPVNFANEIVTTAPVTLTNAGSVLDLQVTLGFSMSAGEVRHARIACSPNVLFDAASVAAISNGGTPGAINGLGTSIISFPITAPNPIGAFSNTSTITITGTRTISSTSNVTCTYGLYDQPSQAANGGSTGLIPGGISVPAPYINFIPSLALTVPTARTNTADVAAASGAFTKFTAAALAPTQAAVGNFKFGLATPTPLKINGTPITLADLLAATSKLVFAGDFSARGAVVPGDVGACTTPGASLTSLTNTSGEIVGIAPLDKELCYTVNGTAAIPIANYTVTLNVVPAAPATYAVSNIGPVSLGSIVHNGTVLQAPVAQYPSGFSGRIFLSNSGATNATYTTRFLPDVNTTAGPAGPAATGTIPAGKHILVDVSQIFTVTAGPPRGSIIVSVSAPSTEIKGAYQLYNSTNGSLTNMALVPQD